MADFQLWATITQVAPGLHAVFVSAVPHSGGFEGVIVRTEVAEDLAHAQARRDELLRSVGSEVTGRGDRVVDVVDD